jgi:hypothetical protein
VGRRRVDLKEAAELLGSTSEAIRKRAKRGTLESETGEDGKVYVWVDEGDARVDGRVDESGPDDATYRDRLFERMASEIDHLREQLREEREANRENRRIIAGLVQRVPELETSTEPRESPQTASEETSGTQEAPQEEERRERSWWQRLFGG